MTGWSVVEPSAHQWATWQLVETVDGVSRVVAMFVGPQPEVVAKRCRDLLARHGTVDVPLGDLEGSL